MINTKVLRLVEVPRTAGQRVLVLLPTWEKPVCKFLMEDFKFKTIARSKMSVALLCNGGSLFLYSWGAWAQAIHKREGRGSISSSSGAFCVCSWLAWRLWDLRTSLGSH